MYLMEQTDAHLIMYVHYRARERQLEKEIHEASQVKVTQVYVINCYCYSVKHAGKMTDLHVYT